MDKPIQKLKLLKPLILGAIASGIAAQSSGQGNPDSEEEDVFELSPFEVSGNSDIGYLATETIAGTRFNSQLKNVPAQVNIMTKEFLNDIAAVDVNEAYAYSANIESDDEYSDAKSDFTSGVINIAASGRIRGIARPGKSRDFFVTLIPRDSYNIDRITVSSGPNSILFGNTNPGGVVNTAFIRANAGTPSRKIGFRIDNYGSFRTSFDVNQPIIQDKLGIRVAAVTSDQKYWQEPAWKNDDRVSVAGIFRPFEGTTVRAYYESMSWQSVKARPTRTADYVTPWINAGRPAFDNSDPDSFDADLFGQLFQKNGDSLRPFYIANSKEEVPFMPWGSGNSTVWVRTKGPGDAYTGDDRHAYSLPADESLFPYDINVQGNGTRNNLAGDVYGGIFEQKLPGGGYLELGYNREKMNYQSADMLKGMNLYADPNLYLPDDNLDSGNPTPNPNYGRYYLETTNSPQIIGYRGESEEMRAQVSYEFDFTERDGALKWFGQHRIAGMFQRSTQMATQQFFNARVHESDWTEQELLEGWRDNGGNPRLLRMRSYIDDPNDPNGSVFSFEFPFDPLTESTQPWGDRTYWGGVDNPWGGDNSQTLQNNRMDSQVLALQSFFFDDRLVLSLGRRKDDPSKATYRLERLAGNRSGFESIYDVELPSDWEDVEGGKTETMGAVAHVLPWLSLFYNESSTWNTEYPHVSPIDGEHYSGNIGDGKDYGFMMRFFEDKVTLRVNKYRNVTGPDWNVPYRNAILPDIQDIEQILYEAFEDGQVSAQIDKPANFDWELPLYPTYNLLSDKDASGYEFRLTANPTKNLRLTLNGSKGDAVSSNIGPEWIQFIEDRSSVYAQYPTVHNIDNASDTVENNYLDLLQSLNTIVQADGQAVDGARSARANLVGRYGFFDGRMKGAFVGGGVRWRDNNVVGYKAEMTPNAFPFAGDPEELLVPNLDSPVIGPEMMNVDAFFGCKMKIGDNINWRIQLNIRNLLDEDDIIPQRINITEGFTTVYRLPQPRSFILTNSFEF